MIENTPSPVSRRLVYRDDIPPDERDEALVDSWIERATRRAQAEGYAGVVVLDES